MKKVILSLFAACLTWGTLSAQRYMPYQLLQDKWEAEQADNKGYVWTITINSKDNINVPGLVNVDYKVSASISHVGPTLQGIYGGNVTISAHRDTDGLNDLLSLIGGKLDTSTNNLVCECDGFLMDVHGYDVGIDNNWQSLFGEEGMYTGMKATERQQLLAALRMLADDYHPRLKPFEQASTPIGFGYITETKLKDVVFDQAKLTIKNGYYRGVFDGFATLGSVGEKEEYLDDPNATAYADSRITTFWGQSINRDVYLKMPSLPLVLRIFPDNQVVLELYSSTGGPFIAKFYGTLDRIPVENTMTPARKQKLATPVLPTEETDDYSDIKAKEQAKQQAEMQKKQAEEDSQAAVNAKVMAQWGENLSDYPKWDLGGNEFSLDLYEDEDSKVWTFNCTIEENPTERYVEKIQQAGFKPIYSKTDDGYGPWYKKVDDRYIGFALDPDGSYDEEDKRVRIMFYNLYGDQLDRAKGFEGENAKKKKK